MRHAAARHHRWWVAVYFCAVLWYCAAGCSALSCVSGLRGLEAVAAAGVDGAAAVEEAVRQLGTLSHEDLLVAAEQMLRGRCAGDAPMPRLAAQPRPGQSRGTLAAEVEPASRVAVPPCGAVPPANETGMAEWAALARVYRETAGQTWSVSDCWNVSSPTQVCNGNVSAWFGVSCGAGRVTALVLPGNRLQGTLSGNFSGLEELLRIDFSQNRISGAVPSVWLGTDSLKYLDLNGNLLDSVLPLEYTGLEQLTHAWLGGNQLSGTLGSVFHGLPQLRYLNLNGGLLSGTFPPVVRGLESLLQFYGAQNNIGGTVPSEYSGLENLQVLGLAANSMSGTIPANFSGLGSLTELYLSGNSLSGSLPSSWLGFGGLQKLYVDANFLTGEFPSDFYGLQNLTVLMASKNSFRGQLSDVYNGLGQLSLFSLSNNQIGGSIPQLITGLESVEELDLSGNALSGSLPSTWWSSFRMLRLVSLANHLHLQGQLVVNESDAVYLEKVDFRYCTFSGPVPAAFLMAPHLASLQLEGNWFEDINTALQAAVSSGQPLAPLSILGLRSNLLAGTLLPALCILCRNLNVLDLANNGIEGLPTCVGSLPVLEILDLSGNPVFVSSWTEPLLGPTSSVRILRLQSVVLSSDRIGEVGANGLLSDLDLSDNPLDMKVDDVLVALAAAFPNLRNLRLSNCGLNSILTTVAMPDLRSLDLSLNADFRGVGYEHTFFPSSSPSVTYVRFGEAFPLLEAFLLDGSEMEFDVISYPPWLGRAVLQNLAHADDCLPLDFLLSPALTGISIVGAGQSSTSASTGAGVDCRENTLELLFATQSSRRYFDSQSLTCPQWQTKASGAWVAADARYLRYEGCTCDLGSVWDAQAKVCAPCPFSEEEGLRCDPFVVLPQPCLVGNVYPLYMGGDAADSHAADPSRALPLYQSDLVLCNPLRCRQPGLCNVGSSCPAQFGDLDHTNSHALRVGNPPLQFECADGFDRDSLLCSRCEVGHWMRNNGMCYRCTFGRFVMVALVAALFVFGSVLWYRRYGRSTAGWKRGWRTTSTVFLWCQLEGLLKAPVLFFVGQGLGSDFNPLLDGLGVLNTYVLLEPGSLACATSGGRPDFLVEAWVVLWFPAFVVAAGAALLLAARGFRAGAGWEARLRALVVQVLLALFVPVTARALQTLQCTSVASLTYVDAAPYISCDDPRLVSVRLMSVFVLVLFSLPILVVPAWLVWCRVRGAGSANAGPGATMPLVISRGVSINGDGEGDGGDEVPPHLVAGDDVGDERELDASPFLPHQPALGSDMESTIDLVFLSVLRDPAAVWWWPVVAEAALKTSLVVVIGVFHVTSPGSAVAVAVVGLLFLQLQLYFQPFRHVVDNRLESAVLACVTAVYFFVVGVAVTDAGHPGSSSVLFAQIVLSILESAMIIVLIVALVWRDKLERKFWPDRPSVHFK